MSSRPVDLHLAALSATPGHSPPDQWWTTVGDPVLAGLIAQGMASSPALACEAAGLVPKPGRSIVGWHRTAAAPADAAYRYADDRARAAAAIAHRYVAVRKWQALLALRSGVIDQYRDNTEIAHFRREAGLVSALDGGMAGALSAQNDGAQARTAAQAAVDLAALARLVGTTPDDVTTQLGQGAAVPELGQPHPPDLSARADLLALQIRLERQLHRAGVSQASLDQASLDQASLDQGVADPGAAPPAAPAQVAVAAWRRAWTSAEAEIRTLTAAVAVSDARISALSGHQPAASRAVADARLAYRAGAGDFATLFVTEVTALGLQEALVEARADRAAAMIDLRTASGAGWSPADLASAAIAAAAAHKGADCE